MSRAGELFVMVRVSLTDAAMCINLINDVFKQSDTVRYFLEIVILYCAISAAFPMSDWKISEGVDWLN